MFDIGWSELAVIAVVALVVIGPKDLPKVLRTAGYWMRKVRGIASEFQSSIEQMAREAELDDLRKQVEEANKAKSALEQSLSADVAKMAEGASKLLDDNAVMTPNATEAAAIVPPGEVPAEKVLGEAVPDDESFPRPRILDEHEPAPAPAPEPQPSLAAPEGARVADQTQSGADHRG